MILSSFIWADFYDDDDEPLDFIIEEGHLVQ
jgi:hypothetical protein